MILIIIIIYIELWECPPGYLLFQEKCYKLIREKKTHVRAQRYCEQEGNGGQIAAPYTNMQVN